MYSWEIENLLKARNYLLENKEYFDMFNTSPQINHIQYNPYDDKFNMRTDDNYEFNFKVYKKDKARV